MNKKGQSILEYVVVFVAIVSVVILAAPAFLKPAMNRYYNSAGGYIESAANGIDAMAQDVPVKFSKTWADYSFDNSFNLPVTVPSFADATSGMADMTASGGSSGSGGSFGDPGCTGWPC